MEETTVSNAKANKEISRAVVGSSKAITRSDGGVMGSVIRGAGGGVSAIDAPVSRFFDCGMEISVHSDFEVRKDFGALLEYE